jgi:hypothetical protein
MLNNVREMMDKNMDSSAQISLKEKDALSVSTYSLWCLLFLICSYIDSPLADEPLYTKNLSTLGGQVGYPAHRDARIQTKDQLSLAVHLGIANNYISENNSHEAVVLDGEFTRVTLEARYGLSGDWELQVEIPWVRQSGGYFDSVIDDFHKVLGLAGRGREDVPGNELRYYYTGPDIDFELTEESDGMGDISISFNRLLYQDDTGIASVGIGYKLATGDEASFLGSGSDDGYIALRYSGNIEAGFPFEIHSQIGFLHAGDTDLFGAAQRSNLWFAALAIDWRYSDTLSILTQFDTQSAPIESDLSPLGDQAYMVAFGLRWRARKKWSFDLSLVENIQGQTAPDVIFQFSVRNRFGES